jgi:hypothetical protein
MRLSLAIVLGLCSLMNAAEIGIENEQRGAINPVDAAVNSREKQIDTNFNGGWDFKGNKDPRPENVLMDAERNRVNMLLKNNREQGVAGASNGFAQAVAPNSKDSKASGSLFRDGKDGPVLGGIANTGRQRGRMQNNQVGDDKHANFTSGKASIDTRVVDFNNKTLGNQHYQGNFVDKRGRVNNLELDPETQSKGNGNGVINYDRAGQQNNYNYNIKTEGEKTSASLVDQAGAQSSLFKRRAAGYTCETEKDGETTCKDTNGQTVGKAVYNENGDTIVYNKRNVIVGRGKAQKLGDEKFKVTVNENLFEANTKELNTEDCYQTELAKLPQDQQATTYQGSKVKISNFKIRYNTQVQADGSKKFEFPDCMELTFDVTLPKGTSFKSLAYELELEVLPMGKYDCTDAGTCSSFRSPCYYCNMCGKRSLNILQNTEGNECELPESTGGTQTIVRTVCPTPEQSQYVLCNGFERNLISFEKYENQIMAKIIVYELGDVEAIKKEFEQKKNNLISKNVILGQYKLAAAKASSSSAFSGGQPDDWQLMEFYVDQNTPRTLVGCTAGNVDYTIGGKDKSVNGNVLATAYKTVGNKGVQLFKNDKCKEYKDQHAQEYEEWQKTQDSTSSGGRGGLANLFGGGGSSRFGNLFGGRG